MLNEFADIRRVFTEIDQMFARANQHRVNRDTGAEPGYQTAGILNELTAAQDRLLFAARQLNRILIEEASNMHK